MRTLLAALLLAGLTFAAASRSNAAPVEITISLEPGTTNWRLLVVNNSGMAIRGFSFAVSNSLQHYIPEPPFFDPGLVCVGLPGDDCYVQHGTDFAAFTLTLPLSSALPPFTFPPGTLLGHFTSSTTSAADVQAFSRDDLFGGTAFDLNLNPIDGVSFQVVPEPGVTGLVLLALLGVGAIRRSRAA